MAFQITEVQKALKGVDYPARVAQRGMDKNSFDDPNAVLKELKGSLTGSND